MLLSAPQQKKLPGVRFNARAHANKADNSHYPGDRQSPGQSAIRKILKSKDWNDLCQNCNARQKENNPVSYKMLKHGPSLPEFNKAIRCNGFSIGGLSSGVKANNTNCIDQKIITEHVHTMEQTKNTLMNNVINLSFRAKREIFFHKNP